MNTYPFLEHGEEFLQFSCELLCFCLSCLIAKKLINNNRFSLRTQRGGASGGKAMKQLVWNLICFLGSYLLYRHHRGIDERYSHFRPGRCRDGTRLARVHPRPLQPIQGLKIATSRETEEIPHILVHVLFVFIVHKTSSMRFIEMPF